MLVINLFNERCQIDFQQSDPHVLYSLHNLIRELLSYKQPNAEWSEKYLSGQWDGKISLYNKRTGTFPIGLFPQVRNLLTELQVDFKVDDKRPEIVRNYPVTCDFGPKLLRDYQIKSGDEFYRQNGGILSLATGAGKTMTSCYIFSKLQVAPVVFVVPALELLKQTKKEFEKYLRLNGEPVKVGIAGDGICDLNMEGINVVTYQTVLMAFDRKYVESKSKIESVFNGTRKTLEQLQAEYDKYQNTYNAKVKIAKNKYKDLMSEILDAENQLIHLDGKEKKVLEKVISDFKKEYDKSIATYVKPELANLKKAKASLDVRLESLADKNKIRQLIQECKAYIVDEAHVASVIIEEIGSMAVSARIRGGMSVDSSSLIELKGEIFKSGFIGTIEQAYDLLVKNGYQSIYMNGYQSILLSDVYSRGWNGTNFDWKKVQTFIRHKNTKPSRWIKAGNSKIGVTDDHSVFIAEQINNIELIEKKSNEVQLGQIMAYDNGYNWNQGQVSDDNYFEILENNYPNPTKVRVVVDITNITKEDLGISYKGFWALKKTKYGHSLNLIQYNKLCNKLPKPELIYTEGSRGIYFNPNIKMSDIAYLLGFYVGDGWIHNNKIVFAVENALIEHILNVLNNLSGIKCNPKIRCINKGSVEISINNAILANLLKYYFEKAKCNNKRIPADWIFNWDEKSRRNLLQGLIDSDGHYSHRGTKRSYSYTTTSKYLTHDIQSLLRSLNVMSSCFVSKPKPGGIVKGRRIIGKFDKYSVNFSAYSLEGNNQGFKGKTISLKHEIDDFIEARVKQIINEPISDYVYDLEMEGHPSFVANGLLVHNSATPYRTDNQEIRIEGALGQKIIEVSPSDLIERGYLVPPKIFMCEINECHDGKTYQEAYELNIIKNFERNYRIKQLAESMKNQGYPTLILVERMEHGNLLEEIIEDAVFVPGGDKGELDPSDEEKNYRRRMLNAVENNEIILIATQWANVGVDAPKITTLILAGSSSSPVTTYQQAGRVLRCAGMNAQQSAENGKPFAIIFDFKVNQKHLKSHALLRTKVYKNERAWQFYTIKSQAQQTLSLDIE